MKIKFNNLGLEPEDVVSYCAVCGSPFTEVHHIFPNTGRRCLSDKYGYVVNLCRKHHNEIHRHPNQGLDLDLKQEAQMDFEKHYGNREEFIKLFSKNYLP